MCTVSSGEILSRGGNDRFQRECVGLAERTWVVIALLHLYYHLEFDQRVARQRGNTDRGAHVAARLA